MCIYSVTLFNSDYTVYNGTLTMYLLEERDNFCYKLNIGHYPMLQDRMCHRIGHIISNGQYNYPLYKSEYIASLYIPLYSQCVYTFIHPMCI